MANPRFRYQSKEVEKITVRPFTFEFPEDLDPLWVPGHRVRSHLFNGFSLTMPYLEPFLVKTMREASAHINDPRLVDDMRQFNGQEASHYKCHRRLNTLLKANGYPELADVETSMEKSYARLSRRSLRTKLAYSAGFECMTNGFTSWLIRKRTQLFAHADPHVTSFWLMHMVEETEHKTVAYDAYMACAGEYIPRALGVWHGSFHVVGYGVIAMWAALKKDKVLGQPGYWLEITREMASLAWNVGPFLLRALLPSHSPRREDDPQWMKDWVAGHATLLPDQPLPLLDTDDPEMPVPFAQAT